MFEKLKRNHLRAKELIKIGNSLNYLSLQLKVLNNYKENSTIVNDDHLETVLFLTYFQYEKVNKKMDEFEWSLTTKLIIPDIGGVKWITLGYAIYQLTLKLSGIACEMGLKDEVQEIIEEGPLYKELKELYVDV